MLLCASVLYVSSGARITIANIWQGIWCLFPQKEVLVFLGYLNQLKKYVFIWSHIKPSGKKTPYVPPSPLKICLFLTTLPLGISVTLSEGGGGMDIFWNHTIFTCHTQSFFYPFWNRKLPAHIWLPCFATINQISTESVKYTFPIVLIMHVYEIKTL